MADVRIRILTEYVGKENAQKLVNDFDKAWKGLQTFTAAAGIAAVALKGIYDQVKQGAALELAAERFDNLAQSIGTTADALDNELNKATSGMMSQAERMASASQIISLGLADNQGDVVRLASLVSELGWDMSQVILTFANNSKMRLDALGLSVTDVEARMKALEAQGIATDEAFDLAVIEAGEAKLALLGSSADTAAGDLKRAEAQVKDFVDMLKTALVPVVGDAAAAFTLLVTWNDQVSAALAEQEANVIQTAQSYEEYVTATLAARVAAGEVGERSAEIVKNAILEGRAVEGTYKGYNLYTEAVWKAAQAQEAETQRLLETGAATSTFVGQTLKASQYTVAWAENTFYAQQATDGFESSLYDAYVSSSAFADNLRRVNDRSKQLIENTQNARKPLDELNAALSQDISSPLDGFISDLQFFIASGGQNFVKAFEAIKGALAAGQVDAEQALGLGGDLEAILQNVKVKAGEIDFSQAAQNISESLGIPLSEAETLLTNIGTDASQIFDKIYELSISPEEAESAYDMLLEMESSINNVAGNHAINFDVSVNGEIPQFAGMNEGKKTSTGNVGFATGGIVPGAFSQAMPIVAHGGEMVLNPNQQSQLFDMLNGGGGSAGGGMVVQVFLDSQPIAARIQTLQGQSARLKQRAGFQFAGT